MNIVDDDHVVFTYVICCCCLSNADKFFKSKARLNFSKVKRLFTPKLLTCCVKHMMISTQVRHHTHLDLTTCRVYSVKHMTHVWPPILEVMDPLSIFPWWRVICQERVFSEGSVMGVLGGECHGRLGKGLAFRITLVHSSGRAAAPGLKPLHLPRAPHDTASVLPQTLVRPMRVV